MDGYKDRHVGQIDFSVPATNTGALLVQAT